MNNRAQIWKPGDFSLGQVHEFMGAFGRAGGKPELLQKAIEDKKIMSGIVSVLLPYADEYIRKSKSYGYPEDFRICTVQEQLDTLKKFFPNLDDSHVQKPAFGELPEGAEGWAVIPKPDKIGTYNEAVATAINVWGKRLGKRKREFTNFLKDMLSEQYLRLTDETKQAHTMLNKSPGGYWLFPFQFGKRWAFRSIRSSHVRFSESEFSLGLYEVAVLLLTHPERIIADYHLYILCTGCEVRSNNSDDLGCPEIQGSRSYKSGIELRFNNYGDDFANEYSSIATGFLPK
ncbi:MAG: hypothetical protein NT116_00225 [Candidatus Parcubacteria bacterium]|nr:hypothetical protein [Candidatus Parcubacteria bacterium]